MLGTTNIAEVHNHAYTIYQGTGLIGIVVGFIGGSLRGPSFYINRHFFSLSRRHTVLFLVEGRTLQALIKGVCTTKPFRSVGVSFGRVRSCEVQKPQVALHSILWISRIYLYWYTLFYTRSA